jgi:hypothetical protein
METDPEAIEKERARLLQIIARECPDRKPGGRIRAWKQERIKAIDALGRLDAGKVGDDVVPL